jgi:hypothetical protein
MKFRLVLTDKRGATHKTYTSKSRRIYARIRGVKWVSAELTAYYERGGKALGENRGVYATPDALIKAFEAFADPEVIL